MSPQYDTCYLAPDTPLGRIGTAAYLVGKTRPLGDPQGTHGDNQ